MFCKPLLYCGHSVIHTLSQNDDYQKGAFKNESKVFTQSPQIFIAMHQLFLQTYKKGEGYLILVRPFLGGKNPVDLLGGTSVRPICLKVIGPVDSVILIFQWISQELLTPEKWFTYQNLRIRVCPFISFHL